MDGWMNGRFLIMDEWMNRWIDGWLMVGPVDRWIYGWINGWADG